MLASDKQVAELVGLFKSGTRLTYKRGEFIIRPGEAPGAVFYIEAGLVKAYNITKYGEENLLIVRKEHEIFPLIWALTGQEREIIYQAMDACVVWRISQDKYLDFLHSHPAALPPILDMVTEMYRIHSERILNLEYRSVRERLVSFLLTMAGRFGQEADGGVLIEVPLRHQDIASSINASRETASRELAALERKNLIVAKRSYILLKDVPALQAFL
jgi:CRP/FNR family transcriptional regulator